MYNKEISPVMFVASGIVFGELGGAIGNMIPSLVALKLGPEDDDASIFMMKVIIGTPIPFALFALFVFIFIFPQRTPKYCLSIGKIKEAKESLRIIFTEERAKEKFKELEKGLKARKVHLSYKDVFTTYKKPFLISCLVILQFNTSGTMAFKLYSNTIFLENVGLKTATVLSNVMYLCQTIGTVVSLFVADSYGRKHFLGISHVSLTVCLGAFATFSIFGS